MPSASPDSMKMAKSTALAQAVILVIKPKIKSKPSVIRITTLVHPCLHVCSINKYPQNDEQRMTREVYKSNEKERSGFIKKVGKYSTASTPNLLQPLHT